MHKLFQFDKSKSFSIDEIKVHKKTLLLEEDFDLINENEINTELSGIDASKELDQINKVGSIKWHLYHLKNAYLIIYPGLDGIIFFKENIYLKNQLNFFRKPIFNHLIHSALTGQLKIKNLDKVFIPMDAGWNNYYHFLMSCIIKMKLFNQKSGFWKPKIGMPDPENFKDVQNINPAFSNKRKHEILNTFSIDPHSILSLKTGIYKVSNLYTIHSNIKQLRLFTFSKYLRSLFENVKTKETKLDNSFQNIFLSRSQSKNARPLDQYEQQIYEENHPGFKQVILDKLSFHEQINLFRNAQNIAGFHGAALTNLLFSNNNIKSVWEYMSDTKKGEDPRLHFHNIAISKKITYNGKYIRL